jgi:hypothetical protein
MVVLSSTRVAISAAAMTALLLTGFAVSAQPATSANTGVQTGPAAPSAIVQPALTDVQRSMSALTISRWKAPNDVRNVAQQNATSIQHDLTDTLPGLLSQADSASGSVPPEFAVYRNIDALYDVLLRVYSTASLAAPQGEVDELFASLQKLEAARSQLGDAILSASQAREAEVTRLQAAVKAATAAAAAPPPPAKSTVVDDGPAASSTVKKKKKPAPKPATSGSSTSPSPQ